MNPMNRRMFRDPMMARRVTGILASSPELMTSVQKAMAKKQPVKAATGMSANTSNVQRRTFLEDIQALPTDIKNAVATIIQRNPGTSVPDAVDAVRQAQNRSNLAALRSGIANKNAGVLSLTTGPFSQLDMSATGKEPFIKVGDVNLSNAFTDGSPLDIFRIPVDQDILFRGGEFGKETSSANIAAEREKKRQQTVAEDTGEVNVVAEGVGSGLIADVGDDEVTTAKNVLTTGADLVEAPAGAGEQLANTVSKTIKSSFDTPTDAGDAGAQSTSGAKPTTLGKVQSASSPVVASLTSSDQTGEQVVPEEASSNEVVESNVDLTPVDASEIPRAESAVVTPFDQDAEAPLTAQDLLNAPGSLLKGTDSGRAEQNDANVGIEGTTKERVKKRLALMKEILGESDDIRNDANYNAMMFCLALASGTSGDLKTDLAEAGKTLLASKAAADTEERKNNRAVATAAISSVLEQEDKEAERKAEKENLNTRLSSAEKLAILSNGTQLEIAKAQINQRDRALDKNIESEKWMAQYNASNKFKLAGIQMDHDTRLAAFSADAAFKRAKLGAEVQLALADFNQESLNKRLEAQLAVDIEKFGQDSAEVKRIKYLQNNPEARDMLINIAKASKSGGFSFDEELALKMAGNDNLAYFPSGAAGMISTLKSLASGKAPAAGGDGSSVSQIAAFNTRPSDDVLEALVSSGVTTINVGGKPFNIGTE